MTTYRLPDYLGGHPVALKTHVIDGPDTRVDVEVMHPESQTVVNLLFGSLIEVKPPLPPEPQDGEAIALCRHATGEQINIFQRDDANSTGAGEHWFGAGIRAGQTWADLCATGTATRLVLDPAADAPELPYVVSDTDGDSIEVEGSPSGRTRISMPGDSPWLSADQCRELGSVLLRRAAEVDRAA